MKDYRPFAVLCAASAALALGLAAFAQEEKKLEKASEPSFIANARQLTFAGKRAGEGYFSADGKQMIFQSEREAGNPFFQIYRLANTIPRHHSHASW